VPAVLLQDPLADQEPEPEDEGHRPRLAGVLGQASGGIEERLLDHVGGVDPALQPRVEPQDGHLAQPGPVPLQELPPELLVSVSSPLDQAGDLAR
jgi:hypothetical protein